MLYSKKHKSIKIIQLLLLLSFIFILSCKGKKYTEYRVIPVPEKIKVLSGSSSYISLRIEIPDGYHIYGNPKGPGIGKPTTLSVKRTASSRKIWQRSIISTNVLMKSPVDTCIYWKRFTGWLKTASAMAHCPLRAWHARVLSVYRC